MFDAILTDAERKSLAKFHDDHSTCTSKIKPCAGYTYGYSIKFTPNNIGMTTEVECTICKKVEDITDCEMW
jgi:hypothetical protein